MEKTRLSGLEWWWQAPWHHHTTKRLAHREQPSNQSHRRCARRARRWRSRRDSAYRDSTTARPLQLISATLKNDKSGTLWYFAFGIAVVDLHVCAFLLKFVLIWRVARVWTRRGDQSCGDSLSWDKKTACGLKHEFMRNLGDGENEDRAQRFLLR